MLKIIGSAALAATLACASASFASGSEPAPAPQPAVAVHVGVPPVANAVPAPAPQTDPLAPAPTAESGLAPGQTAADFRAWLAASPGNRAAVLAFRNHLAAQGVADIVPIWQLIRTSSSWRDCGSQPFEVAPADKWDHIVETLKFVRDQVVPAVGPVEALSGYRDEHLNACSAGAPQSAHRNFFAIDLTPVNASVTRDEMISDICHAHARFGPAYQTGLGFYTGKRFHVDSHGFRKWGPDGRGATSPCVRVA